MLGVLLDQTYNRTGVDDVVGADDVGMTKVPYNEKFAWEEVAHEIGGAATVDHFDGDEGVQALRPRALHARIRPAPDHVAQLHPLALQQLRQ